MTWLIIPLMGILNRVRGGGFYGDKIPFKALYAVTPIVGLLALLVGHPVYVSLSFAIAYLIWALPAWSRWYDLGNLPDDYHRTPGVYNSAWEKWTDWYAEDDYEAMIIRHGFFGGLGVALVSIVALNPIYLCFALLLPWMIVKSYDFAWRFGPKNTAIQNAEILSGMAWGLFIWLTSLFT